MSSDLADPVLHALARAAVAATGASDGWLLAVEGDVLRVVAVAGGVTGTATLAAAVPAGAGSAGFVAASGQPLAVAPRGDDPRFSEGTAQLLGRRPTSVLSVPAATEDSVVGVLELVDKAGGGSFSFDDVEIATMLADIAAVALLRSQHASVPPAPLPSELGGELERLAAADPVRYSAVASAVGALLARG